MTMKKLSNKSYPSYYEIIRKLGRGGNAEVSLVRNKRNQEDVALKVLTRLNKERKQRFTDEIAILRRITGCVDGILPILESDDKDYWYTMPIAKSLLEEINERASVDFICIVAIQLAETLELLHQKKIYHRDLKPANLYYYNDRACIGDFGLVDFPDKNNNVTRDDRGLGAIFTIAPEMKRNPQQADGAKADVYSFAKTLWMLLTKDEKGFDGQYNWQDTSCMLHGYEHLKDEYLVEVENLLKIATNNDPNNRPTMAEVNKMLQEWEMVRKDDMKQQKNEWQFIMNDIFSDIHPEYSILTDVNDIVTVLGIISKSRAYNHMLFSSGGLDLGYVEKTQEQGCICVIADGFCDIIKPHCLYIARFDDSRWNYFLLEAAPLSPIFSSMHESEILIEDYPGHYVDATDSVYGVYDYDTGKKLPKGYRLVERYLKGKFLIVSKMGLYNQMTGTYDGRHSLMNDNEFRHYILRLQERLNELINKGYSEEKVLNSNFFNVHPYPERIHEDFLPINKDEYKLPDGIDYVKESYQSWNFMSIIDIKDIGEGKLIFAFRFNGVDEHYGMFSETCRMLNTYGYITSKTKGDLDDCFVVRNRDLAINICSSLNETFQDKCKEYDGDSIRSFYFDIVVRKVQMPTHLFTEDEIREAMQDADDRVNNVLVIDENGYAHVISDVNKRFLYPVHHEIWGSRKNYVGKYSSLSDAQPVYMSSLVLWQNYLSTGIPQYDDHYAYCNIEEVVASITKMME